MYLTLKMKLNRKTFSWLCGKFANPHEVKHYEGNNKQRTDTNRAIDFVSHKKVQSFLEILSLTELLFFEKDSTYKNAIRESVVYSQACQKMLISEPE